MTELATRSGTIDPIRSFILSQYLSDEPSESLRDDDLLLEGGIIDSGSVMELVAFLEARFGFRVEDADLVVENFATLHAIAAYVESRRARK
ncbi:MAG TPA: acyl carrier protein [Candidatus Eisenbacteria bacterium]